MNVVDHEGVVRGEQRRRAGRTRSTRRRRRRRCRPRIRGVTVQSHRIADGRQVLDFAAPVLFQGKTIGSVHLGIYEAPLTAVANLVLVLLAILTIVTVAAVAGGTYLLAQRLAAPDPRAEATRCAELANGRYDYRIAEDAQGRVRRALRRVRQDGGRAREAP